MIFCPHFVCGAVVREVVPSFGCFVLRGSPSSASPTPVERGKLFGALLCACGRAPKRYSREDLSRVGEKISLDGGRLRAGGVCADFLVPALRHLTRCYASCHEPAQDTPAQVPVTAGGRRGAPIVRLFGSASFLRSFSEPPAGAGLVCGSFCFFRNGEGAHRMGVGVTDWLGSPWLCLVPSFLRSRVG